MDNFLMRFVFDRKHVATETKEGLLQIEIRKQKSANKIFVSTGIHLLKHQFSEKNGFTCVKRENCNAITAKAKRFYTDIEKFLMSDECRTIQDVNVYLQGGKSEMVYNLIEEELRTPLTDDVRKTCKILLNYINEYGKITTFNKTTSADIADFEKWLINEKGNTQPTAFKKLQKLKYFFRKAKERGLCKNNPFDDFKIKRGKNKEPIYLTIEELQRIKECKVHGEMMQKVKDLFLFQASTGMAFCDLSKFSKDDIEVIGGKKTIRSNRKKTDESFVLLFLPQAEAIAVKYDYQLPKLSNQKYNECLKILAEKANISKNITTHSARHTFATYLLNEGVPIDSVSRALGHTSTRQTQHYARLLARKVISDMEKLL